MNFLYRFVAWCLHLCNDNQKNDSEHEFIEELLKQKLKKLNCKESILVIKKDWFDKLTGKKREIVEELLANHGFFFGTPYRNNLVYYNLSK